MPPGLAFIALSDKAWARAAESKLPKFYFNLAAAKKSMLTNETAWTPAITLVLGLDVALGMLRAEGMEQVWARHERLRAPYAPVASVWD